MDQSVPINLSQLLFFVLTGLIGIAWKSLNDKFTTIISDQVKALAALDASYKERLETIRRDMEMMKRDVEDKSRERRTATDTRLMSFESSFSNVGKQLADIDKDLKELRLSLAQKFATKDDLKDAVTEKASHLSRLEEQISKMTRSRSASAR